MKSTAVKLKDDFKKNYSFFKQKRLVELDHVISSSKKYDYTLKNLIIDVMGSAVLTFRAGESEISQPQLRQFRKELHKKDEVNIAVFPSVQKIKKFSYLLEPYDFFVINKSLAVDWGIPEQSVTKILKPVMIDDWFDDKSDQILNEINQNKGSVDKSEHLDFIGFVDDSCEI